MNYNSSSSKECYFQHLDVITPKPITLTIDIFKKMCETYYVWSTASDVFILKKKTYDYHARQRAHECWFVRTKLPQKCGTLKITFMYWWHRFPPPRLLALSTSRFKRRIWSVQYAKLLLTSWPYFKQQSSPHVIRPNPSTWPLTWQEYHCPNTHPCSPVSWNVVHMTSSIGSHDSDGCIHVRVSLNSRAWYDRISAKYST